MHLSKSAFQVDNRCGPAENFPSTLSFKSFTFSPNKRRGGYSKCEGWKILEMKKQESQSVFDAKTSMKTSANNAHSLSARDYDIRKFLSKN